MGSEGEGSYGGGYLEWSLLIAGCRSTGSVRPEVAHAYVPV